MPGNAMILINKAFKFIMYTERLVYHSFRAFSFLPDDKIFKEVIQMKNINDYEIPPVLMDFLSYMQTIRGRSANTVKVYFYDLRVFFRFMKLRRNLADKNTPFEEIPIDDVDIGFIRTITLSDLYAFMAFVSNDGTTRHMPGPVKFRASNLFLNILHLKQNF